ncbi:MAG: Asp-tRNA(Asn)/Glu-tRNA(Gln) amidotransferase subunit GatB [Anaerolineales bacterium]|nr:Asp-tRNA(Asn)/Glu-tRNA(Gln) amidotransferase subunit GatB [Anaerolineales bacterium]
MTEYEAVIGLETHIQLNTNSKIFCSCKADSWNDPPNTNICPVCTGLPGVLPVLNRKVVEKAVLLAAAMHAEKIAPVSYMDRKNYFYPDLPKGYQISQYDCSIAKGGYLDVPMPDGEMRRVRIHKLHIEEDAGKTVRQRDRRWIDFNRCGVPLIEMVTEPDLRSADEAAQYVIRLRQLLRWIGVSEADMERGQLRCDGNVSIREKGSTVLNTKTEIKNVNSIENLRDAIAAEIARQIRTVEAGDSVKPWTLDWDDSTNTLRKMRSKETEADYHYFREPDLLPVVLEDAWREDILKDLPELPLDCRQRFMDTYDLPQYDAEILTEDRSRSEYYEKTAAAFGGDPKIVSNWMMNDVLRMLRDSGKSAGELKLSPEYLALIIRAVVDNQITSNTGKDLLEKVEESGRNPEEIIKADGLAQVSDDSALRPVVEALLAANPEQVEAYRGGKETLIGWFVGQVMRESRGKANPQLVREILEELLKE